MALVGRFGPPLALMAVIFLLSAQPDLNSGLGAIDAVGRKFVHAGEYALLWFLWWRALGYGPPWAAVAIAIVYAGTDEYHQSHVEGRHGTPVDVLIDSAGAVLATWWFAVRRQPARTEA